MRSKYLVDVNRAAEGVTLRRKIEQLIYWELSMGMRPWWFVTFHFRDGKNDGDTVAIDMADFKRKLKRIVYKRRDRGVIGSGAFLFPRMLFVNEVSAYGTGQFHEHLVLEALPTSLNTQSGVESLFKTELPSKVKAMSVWKSVDVQRIICEPKDLKCLAHYLSKQITPDFMSLDTLNTDFTGGMYEEQANYDFMPCE